nr:hypothetical protein Itr_chr05CG10240 [Ipomoea trifida]
MFHLDYIVLCEDYGRLQEEHQALQSRVRQQEINHIVALQTVVLDWRGIPNFVRVVDSHAHFVTSMVSHSLYVWSVDDRRYGRLVRDAVPLVHCSSLYSDPS